MNIVQAGSRWINATIKRGGNVYSDPTGGGSVTAATREDLPLRRGHLVADLPRRHRHAGRDEARGGVEERDGTGHAEEDVPDCLALLVRTAFQPQNSRVMGLEVERVKVLRLICH